MYFICCTVVLFLCALFDLLMMVFDCCIQVFSWMRDACNGACFSLASIIDLIISVPWFGWLTVTSFSVFSPFLNWCFIALSVIRHFAQSLVCFSGEPLTVQSPGTQTRSFCYVSDLVYISFASLFHWVTVSIWFIWHVYLVVLFLY